MPIKKIFYSRVSKEEEGKQDQEAHKKAVFEKFQLKEDEVIVFEERGSAYDLNKFEKRHEFVKLINILFDAEDVTVMDIFKGKYKKKQIQLYIYDYHRIMRNIEACLYFQLLCDWFNIEVHSYKQGPMSHSGDGEHPSQKLVRYMMYSVHSFSGEEYSYTISTNVKKNIYQKKGVTYSSKGNTWAQFKHAYDIDKQGNPKKVKLTPENVIKLQKFIRTQVKYYQTMGEMYYYQKIIEQVKQKFKILIHKSYISKLKNGMD